MYQEKQEEDSPELKTVSIQGFEDNLKKWQRTTNYSEQKQYKQHNDQENNNN